MWQDGQTLFVVVVVSFVVRQKVIVWNPHLDARQLCTYQIVGRKLIFSASLSLTQSLASTHVTTCLGLGFQPANGMPERISYLFTCIMSFE